MTRPKPRPKRPVDAVRAALERETAKRNDIKPIEIVKIALSSYQAYLQGEEPHAKTTAPAVESDDRAGLKRGTQAAIDKLLFNANYWRAAYEDRIVAASPSPEDARACLQAIAVWNTHTLRLNTLPAQEVVANFERFCPPFSFNNRRGSNAREGGGKGPVPDFKREVNGIAQRVGKAKASALLDIVADIEAEATLYESLNNGDALDALFAILPAWCLQERIELVRGSWWDDCDVMCLIVETLRGQFARDGFGDALCQYFSDSCHEAIDSYQREVSSDSTRFGSLSIGELVELVHEAREAHPDAETEGYGPSLPAWLSSKEQLIWNILVCSVYGPASARPLLVESPRLIGEATQTAQTDVITELAQHSFARYIADRASSNTAQEYSSFGDQPADLRNSSIASIRSIPDKLAVLGYGIMPLGSCYPEQRIAAFSPSEVECLAILEHRRWLRERTEAGWTHGAPKDVEAKVSPYLVAWEDLPDRAREWNRSAVRNIPTLLANANLAITR